jgi:hypothetical protein
MRKYANACESLRRRRSDTMVRSPFGDYDLTCTRMLGRMTCADVLRLTMTLFTFLSTAESTALSTVASPPRGRARSLRDEPRSASDAGGCRVAGVKGRLPCTLPNQ